ncbi:hypothetical protein GCM10025866_12520 [Naasia aerilata]|uniref:Zinc/manganese transport system substrate-binding protein n=1 Tax=Naasia aerilata TaxID=1162966 RepID=A0ABM8GAV2_9MICO|nr:hypothetical protein GCM10025866_12520 [Naasia aerilata]
MRIVVLLAAALLLGGCATSADDSRLSVVASTDVYADIARAVAGDRAEVRALLDSPAKDPHEYEASGRDLLAVSRADLVVQNGGGYDTFVTPLLKDAPDAVVVTAVDLVPHSGDNEHVWYDLRTAAALATRLAAELSRLDPGGARGYEDRAGVFLAGIDALESRVAAVRPLAEGRTVLAPEPVPLYLLDAMGITDRTPPDLAESVEEGTDVAPGVLLGVLDTVRAGSISLLADNPQTATGQTGRIRQAAEASGVPVVEFTETLPRGPGTSPGWARTSTAWPPRSPGASRDSRLRPRVPISDRPRRGPGPVGRPRPPRRARGVRRRPGAERRGQEQPLPGGPRPAAPRRRDGLGARAAGRHGQRRHRLCAPAEAVRPGDRAACAGSRRARA